MMPFVNKKYHIFLHFAFTLLLLYFLITVELKTEKKIRELDDVIKRSLAVSTKVSCLVMRADEGKL